MRNSVAALPNLPKRRGANVATREMGQKQKFRAGSRYDRFTTQGRQNRGHERVCQLSESDVMVTALDVEAGNESLYKPEK